MKRASPARVETTPPWPAGTGLLAALCFFFPLLVKVAFGLPRLMLQNFTDGVFYMGYALQFRELVERVGLNYYAVRFGGILPDALAFSLVGPTAGLSLVRYSLAGLCGVLLFLLFTRRFHPAWGVFAAAAWALNPGAIRLLQTAYVDVAGTYFLCAGVVLLLFPQPRAWMALVAGMLLLLAVSAHLHAAIALFFLLPLIVMVRLEEGWRRMVMLGVWSAAGGMLVALGAAGFYYFGFGLADWTSPTREYFRYLRDGAASNWRLPWAEVFVRMKFWFLPVLALPLYALLPRRTALATGSLLGLTGYIGFLWYGDVFQGGFSLSMFYYFSFAVPAVVLFASAAAPLAWEENPRKRQSPLLQAAAMLGFLLSPVLGVKGFHGAIFWWAAAAAAILACCYLLRRGRAGWRVWGASVLLAGMSWLISTSPSSVLALGHYYKGDDLPWLVIGQKLGQSLPHTNDDAGILRFWFDDDGETPVRMVQSFYLHNFTRLQRDDFTAIPYAPLDADDTDAIRRSGVRHLVLLGLDEATLDRGMDHLRRAGVPFRVLNRRELREKKDSIRFAHLEITPPGIVAAEPLDPSAFLIQQRAQMARTLEGLRLTTAPVKWNFDGLLPLPPLAPDQGLRVRFRVRSGLVLFGLCSDPEGADTASSQMYAPAPEVYEAILEPADAAKARYLFVRNFLPNMARSQVELESVELVRVNPPRRPEGESQRRR